MPDSTQNVTQKLLSTAIFSVAIRGLGPVSSLLLTLILARMLGVAETGAFYLMGTLMTIAAIIAKLGFDNALQRFAGTAAAKNDWQQVHGLYHQALKITTSISLPLACLIVIFADSISSFLLHDQGHQSLVIWMGLTVISFTLTGVHAAMLKAISRPLWGGFIEAAALPVFTILLATIAMLVIPGFSLSAENIAFIFFLGATSSALLGIFLLKSLPVVTKIKMLPRKQLLASCLPLTLVELLNYSMLWIPMLVLGAMADTSSAGLYNIAQRLAGQLGLILLVFAAITAPQFAALHKANKSMQLHELAIKATRGLCLLGIPPGLLLIIWPEYFLSLFGEQFIDAAAVLKVLVLGQLVNLVTGPVGYLLAMTGHERLLRNTLFVTTMMTFILSILLIPDYGAIGAAWAVTIPMIIQNLIGCLLLQLRLNLPFLLILSPTAK